MEGLVQNFSVVTLVLEALAILAFLVILFGAKSNGQITDYKFRQGLGFIVLLSIILVIISWLFLT